MCLYDINDQQLQDAEKAIRKQLEGLEGEGLLRDGQTADKVIKAVSFSSDLREAVEGAEYIQVDIVKHLALSLHTVEPPTL